MEAKTRKIARKLKKGKELAMAMAILTFSLSKVAKVKIYLYYHTLEYSTGSEDISFELFHRELTDPTSFLG